MIQFPQNTKLVITTSQGKAIHVEGISFETLLYVEGRVEQLFSEIQERGILKVEPLKAWVQYPSKEVKDAK